MLTLSPHAQARIRERAITNDNIAAALAGRSRTTHQGRICWYDRSSRTTLVVDPETLTVVTVFRAHRSAVKRAFGKWQKHVEECR